MRLTGHKMLPGFILFIFTLILVQLNIEIKDKKEFIELNTVKRLKEDLNKILEVLPEGVIIKNGTSILMTNNQSKKLLGEDINLKSNILAPIDNPSKQLVNIESADMEEDSFYYVMQPDQEYVDEIHKETAEIVGFSSTNINY